MDSKWIRKTFLDYFEQHQHKIVPSAPIVVKNDPTLMFTNAGMNQFKDHFLGNSPAPSPRIADTQKCLRVSGKHNDLEEVGTDGYHHTLFEMLGNWSFGDYFKEKAIELAWKLLTDVYKMDPDRLYVSVFGGDEKENLSADTEAIEFWKKWLPESRILLFGKKDNFWEMGDSGPCGPCSEIHVDLRANEQRDLVPGHTLVNVGTPEVIEIWNLVFIQFNRKADGSLEELPQKHIDTGMGFERLCLALQGKKSSYDTDLFRPYIEYISKFTGIPYQGRYDAEAKTDLAMRVIADHIRAVSFAIADGCIPSNTGQGYVIRRILRRAVRYYFSFLKINDPFLFRLVPLLAESMGDVFTELRAQKDLVVKVIQEEEGSFLRTLEGGLKKLDALESDIKCIPGQLAFELYDTYGFPFDLTQLIARENNWEVDVDGFHKAMNKQKERSRADARKILTDWVQVKEGECQFVGYDRLEQEQTHLLKWRKIDLKDKSQYQLVFQTTPFYPEGGGQVGDKGVAFFGEESIEIVDTVKENELILHIAESLPENPAAFVRLHVNNSRRALIENNHSATHLLHAALRKVLGAHVQQRGSLVQEHYLRFDFSHFKKVEDQELDAVEQIVNEKIRENISMIENRSLAIDEAKKAGAMMLFGEKYGEQVRMITFDPKYSVELCGGCHVKNTGQLGFFKITTETAVAAGIRRIEAVTSVEAEKLIRDHFHEIAEIRQMLKAPKSSVHAVQQILDENRHLQKQIQELKETQASELKKSLIQKVLLRSGIHFLAEHVQLDDSKIAKSLIYQLGQELQPAVILFGFEENGKAQLMCYVSEELCKINGFNAVNWIREIARAVDGGGGGQAFFASAGGKNPSGLPAAIQQAHELILKKIETA